MRRTPRNSVVVGVDVGGVKKGFHAVALRDGQFFGKLNTLDAVAVIQWCRSLRASAVGIDAPCCWSLSGHARPCESALAMEGIHAFATPSRAVGGRHPFYGWMRKGDALYRRIAHHYPLFDGTLPTSRPVSFETFPHAVGCALAGTILSGKRKRIDRLKLLRETGLSTESLTNIDQIDAALCAVTARYLLAGNVNMYGNLKEGFIVVPKIERSSRKPASIF
ncbi:MAG TPA: DUF429 domain-containing protein [Nitrospira sp.]|nr:DUF429 domain-containing protein [Nitrospira sp.]